MADARSACDRAHMPSSGMHAPTEAPAHAPRIGHPEQQERTALEAVCVWRLPVDDSRQRWAVELQYEDGSVQIAYRERFEEAIALVIGQRMRIARPAISAPGACPAAPTQPVASGAPSPGAEDPPVVS